MKISTVIFIFLLSLCNVQGFAQDMSAAEKTALELANDGKFAEAAAGFELVLVSEPRNLNTLNILVTIYEKLNNKEKQFEVASKGQALMPDDENWNYTKGELAVQTGRYDEAILLADKFTAKFPDSAYMYLIKGSALDAQGKIQAAIGAYSKTLKLHPGNAYARLNRAKDFAAISRYENAITDFTAIINMGQELDEIYNRRGLAYYSLQKYAEASADFTKAITINPDNQFAYANKGWVEYNNADYINAAKDFAAAAFKDDNYADAWYGLASTADKQKNYSLSINHAEKAIALDKKMPAYYAVYSKALMGANRDNDALNAADKIILTDNKNPDGYILKASALSNLKRYPDALTAINSGINIYPENYLMYSVRSFIYSQQGNTAAANADTEKARTLSTKN